MSKFYSILLEDEMHDALKRKSFETGEHISSLVRKGISIILKSTSSCESKKKADADN
jgi:hypothetical protein